MKTNSILILFLYLSSTYVFSVNKIVRLLRNVKGGVFTYKKIVMDQRGPFSSIYATYHGQFEKYSGYDKCNEMDNQKAAQTYFNLRHEYDNLNLPKEIYKDKSLFPTVWEVKTYKCDEDVSE